MGRVAVLGLDGASLDFLRARASKEPVVARFLAGARVYTMRAFRGAPPPHRLHGRASRRGSRPPGMV